MKSKIGTKGNQRLGQKAIKAGWAGNKITKGEKNGQAYFGFLLDNNINRKRGDGATKSCGVLKARLAIKG